ncbi:MAG: sugar transferase [Lachnospiraceae bacterium]|nr:sugar transferase [Lachnospiraceae bacterium]MBQ5560584.1 sugar transferase [Lachnospiraceae bacterium]MCR4803979.1 sugar transferase [Lachnospiraceae bacterium]
MGRFNRGASTNLIYIMFDILFGLLAYILAGLFSRMGTTFLEQSYFLICVAFMLIFVLANKESRLYNVTTFFYVDRIIKRVTKSFIIAGGVTSTLLFYVGRAKVDQRFYIIYLVTSFVLLLGNAFFVRYVLMKRLADAPRTLIIGNRERFQKFERFVGQSNLEMEIVGYVCISDDDFTEDEYVGKLSELEDVIHQLAIDQVYIMQRRSNQIDIQPYLNMCMEMGVTVRIIMNAFRAGAAQTYVSSVGTYPILTYHMVSLNTTERFIKRCIDIIGSLFGIILSSPVMLITAILIKIESEGPVIFKQERVGQNGRHFFMYKFRSMCVDAEEKKQELMEQNEMDSSFMFKMQDDPRITKVGRFIRKTSIDELPQFFNVLKGDMSLVGTRPPTLDEVELYERGHWRRMSIKPGITGMWQVSGRSSITDFDEIVELDTQYIDRWNVLLDLQILIKTVLQVFRKKGAY